MVGVVTSAHLPKCAHVLVAVANPRRGAVTIKHETNRSVYIQVSHPLFLYSLFFIPLFLDGETPLAINRKSQHSKLQNCKNREENKKVALLKFWCSTLAYNYSINIIK